MTLKYLAAIGKTSGGTFISRSTGSLSGRPIKKTTSDAAAPKTMVVATSRLSLCVSPAPKKRLISTDAPMLTPDTPRMTIVMTGFAALTAASAFSPANLPITMESTAL